MSELIKIVIKTEIRKRATTTAPTGVKSRHTINIDNENKKVNDEVHTGTTNVGPFKIKSIRNDFKILSRSFRKDSISFSVKGQTAAGVYFLPSINYKLNFIVYPSLKLITITGSHDGYPSYTISVNDRTVYDAEQGYLTELYGDGEGDGDDKTDDDDVQVAVSNFPWARLVKR